MQVSPLPTILRYGIISGLISIITFVGGVVTGLMNFSSMMSSILFFIVSLIISISVIVLGVRQYRDVESNGNVTLGQAFIVAFGITVIGLVIGTIGQYIYTNLIDPTFYETMAEEMVAMFEKYNVPEADAEKALDQIRNSNTIGNMFWNLAKGAMFMAVVSLIIAAIMKKQPDNPFEKI
jgi:uncharacterized membrane protein YhaH (DUF805 family)